jgi:hypothetical protein
VSHLSRLKFQYADLLLLKTALTSLGLEFIEGPIALRNDRYRGDAQVITVDLLVKAASLGERVGVDVGFQSNGEGGYTPILDSYDLNAHWSRSDRNPYRDQKASFSEALCIEYTISALRQQHGAAITIKGVERNAEGLRLKSTIKTPAVAGMRI